MHTIRVVILLASALVVSRSAAQPSPLAPFSVRGQFERGEARDEMRFVFSLQPAPPQAPLVHLLPETPHRDRTPLAVSYDPASGRYTAVFALPPKAGEGRLEIELADPAGRLLDLHGAAVAVREHGTAGPMSRSSVDGNFAVYTTPDGLPRGAQILIAAVELPLQPLPRGVMPPDVLSVHAVAFAGTPDSAPPEWHVAVSDPRPKAPPPSLLFLPGGSTTWTNLGGTVLPEHSLVVASFAGPGTYLLLRRVWP